MTTERPDLITLADIARATGLTQPAVSNWRARYDDFPAPAIVAAGGRVLLWDRAEVFDWYIERKLGGDLVAYIRERTRDW